MTSKRLRMGCLKWISSNRMVLISCNTLTNKKPMDLSFASRSAFNLFSNFSGIGKNKCFFSGLFIYQILQLRGNRWDAALGEGFAKLLRLTFELEETQPGKYKEPQDVDSAAKTTKTWRGKCEECRELCRFFFGDNFLGIFLGLYCIQLRFWKGKGVLFFFNTWLLNQPIPSVPDMVKGIHWILGNVAM